MLFTIGVAAHYARRRDDPAVLSAALEEIETTAAQARSELRASLQQLSEPPDGLAFATRLAGETRLFQRTSGCQVVMTTDGDRRDLPLPIEDLLIDAALEGLRNAVKHERARLALVHLSYSSGAVALALSTVGQGISPTNPAESARSARSGWAAPDPVSDQGTASGGGAGTGAGLALLRQRAAQLGGTLGLTCDRIGKTVLRLEVPAHAAWASELTCKPDPVAGSGQARWPGQAYRPGAEPAQ
jgi:signal transduction histidine kinase